MMAIVLISFSVRANECAEMTKCIEQISKLTGKKYIYDSKEVKGGVQSTLNVQLTSENADNFFTYALYLNGYARVPTIENDTYLIINARDIRYQAYPLIAVDSITPPKLIPNYDYYMMTFKFKHYANGQLRMAANSIRPFMSRYGRTIELNGTGSLTVQESAAALAREYEIIKAFDRDLTKEEIKKDQEREAESKEERKFERRQESRTDNKDETKEKTDKKW